MVTTFAVQTTTNKSKFKVMNKSIKLINLEKSIASKTTRLQSIMDVMALAAKDCDEKRMLDLSWEAVYVNKELRELQFQLNDLKRLHAGVVSAERALLKQIQYCELDGPAEGYGEYMTPTDADELQTLKVLIQKGIVQSGGTDEKGETFYISTPDAPIIDRY